MSPNTHSSRQQIVRNISGVQRIVLFFARIVCAVIGHDKERASVGNIGVIHCARCHRITDQLTVRHRRTKGDQQRMMATVALATGSTFNGINWKKGLAHFTKSNGVSYAVPLHA